MRKSDKLFQMTVQRILFVHFVLPIKYKRDMYQKLILVYNCIVKSQQIEQTNNI